MPQLGNLFSSVAKASKKAVENIGKITGQSQDPEIRVYNSLEMQDFDAIAKEFGTDETMEYIRRMESRRLLGGNNANA